jgi:serine/threonine-protein kinase
VATLAQQIALGLAAAHKHGIVHGDLKPANLLVTPHDTVKITDVGLSRRSAMALGNSDTVDYDAQTMEGLFGTPNYMSPEQARGESLTIASDVFSFGLILYEMLTGRRAIIGTGLFDTLRKIELLNVDQLALDLPKPFNTILRSALVKSPPERRISMSQIAESLANDAQHA